MSEWRTCKLGDVADVQTGPFGSQLKNEQYIKGGIPVVTVEHIVDFKIADFDYPSVTQEDKERLSKYLLKSGDIVFTRVGSVDLSAFVTLHQDGWLFSSRMLRVRPSATIDSRFLSYFFQQEKFRTHILNIAVGATMPSINTEILREIEISFPSLPEQRAIASILCSFDDKIDLLRRQNKTLEAMAETLFRQRFVEEADEGWEEIPLEQLCSVTRGASPRPIIQYVINGTVPWIKIADGSRSGNLFIENTKEFIIEDGVGKSVKVFPGDLILSNSATCGFPYFVELEGCIHDGWLLFRGFKRISKFFLFFFLRQIFRELTSIADGSVQDNLNTSILKTYPVKVPPAFLVNDFDNNAGIVIGKIRSNMYQIRTLEKMRNTLLPKLMSGEVRVKV